MTPVKNKLRYLVLSDLTLKFLFKLNNTDYCKKVDYFKIRQSLDKKMTLPIVINDGHYAYVTDQAYMLGRLLLRILGTHFETNNTL